MRDEITTIRIGPLPEPFAAVYRRRGMDLPTAASRPPLAALWPYRPRSLHRAYARAMGYFWIPCVLCTREFGGHEITESIPDPTQDAPPGVQAGVLICPVCTATRHGGRP